MKHAKKNNQLALEIFNDYDQQRISGLYNMENI